MSENKITTQWGSKATAFDSRSKEYKTSLVKAIKKLDLIYKSEFGIQLFLTYGTLLGAVRENNFIGHDFDVDLSYISRYEEGYEIAEESSKILNAIINDDIEDVKFSKGHFAQYKVIVKVDSFKFTIEIFTSFFKANKFFQYFWIGGDFEKRNVWPLSQMVFKDETFFVPNNKEAFLERIYGVNWKVPNPNFSYDMSAVNFKLFKEILPIANREYWNKYYSRKIYKDVWTINPSSFCKLVSKDINVNSRVLEIGCGNGRDSYYFAEISEFVKGVDYSKSAIDFCSETAKHRGLTIDFNTLNLYNQGDVEEFCKQNENGFDIVYARFLVHAISLAGEKTLLNIFEKCLTEKGIVRLEFRTIGDKRINEGESISSNEKSDGHYRRFINPEKFRDRIELSNKMKVFESIVSDEFAVFGDEKPEVCRMIIKKN